MQLRISAGKYKNKRLRVAPATKPVRERVKLAVFSILDDKIKNANVLDLFAGSGNLGLEALSRGAKKCTFIDNDYDAIKSIKENTSTSANFVIQRDDATKFVLNSEEKYDLIFLDPPYDLPIHHILKNIHEIMNTDGLTVYFHATQGAPSRKFDLQIADSRTYGITTVDFIALK